MKKLFGGLCLLSTSFMLFGCKKSVPEATKPKMNEFFVYEGKGTIAEQTSYYLDEDTNELVISYKSITVYDTFSDTPIHLSTYKYKDGAYSLTVRYDYEYNEDGKLARQYYCSDSKTDKTGYYSKTEYEYQDKKKIETNYSLNNKGKWKIEWKYEYNYDDNNNLISEINWFTKLNSTKLVYSSKTEYEYNSNNLVTKETLTSATLDGSEWEDRPTAIKTYEYDENNNLIKKQTVRTFSNDTYEYKYDSNNNVIEVTYIYSLSKSKGMYTYDSNNNVILEEWWDYNKSTSEYVPFSKYEYKYDSNNNRVLYLRSIYDDELLAYKESTTTTITYNSLGKQEKEELYKYDSEKATWVLSSRDETTYKVNE